MNLTSKYLPTILEAWAIKLMNWVKYPPHILCLSEHHLSTEVIQSIIVDNYNLGAYYCRKFTKCGGVCIFLHKSYQFINVDLNSHCKEQDIDICAKRLVHTPLNFCVLSIYRSPTGNFDTFIKKIRRNTKSIISKSG
jgi:hypothetical protein